MKKKLIAIYLIGCIVSYFIVRNDLKKSFEGKWTTSDRVFAIAISAGSWLTVVAVGLYSGVRHLAEKRNEPANW